MIPAQAQASLNIRLVPNQAPDRAIRQLRRWLGVNTPPTMQSAIVVRSSTRPVLLDRHHPMMETARIACLAGFGVEPVMLRSGGSIPAVSLFQDHLRIPTVLMGLAQPGAGTHGPNERLHLPTFFQGVATSMAFLRRLGRGPT